MTIDVRYVPTTAYTLRYDSDTENDDERLIRTLSDSNTTITVPKDTDAPFKDNTVIAVEMGGAGEVTISPDTDVIVNGTLTITTQYSRKTLIKIGKNVWNFS